MMKNNSLLSQPEILKEVFDHSDVTILITSESGELLYKNRDSVDLLFGSNPSSLPSAAGKKPFDRHFVFRNTASNVKLIETEQGSYYLYLFADDAEKKQLLNENLALRDIIDHWGVGTSGRLGTGNTTNQTEAVQVLAPDGKNKLTKVKDIAVGYDSASALLEDGTVVSWGNNGSY
ncbi:MAG: hypothetical protein ACI4QO_05175, partial [Clostridia bacterium]